MKNTIHILMLEDTASDATLIEDELQSSGLDFVSRIVSNRKDYLTALDNFSPDIILSDYNLPQYDGVTALHAARLRLPDIPFILVTGAIGEDLAIDIFINGANDYVMKNRLQRLVPAVQRALAEAGEITGRKEAEAALPEAMTSIKTLSGLLPICASCKKIRDDYGTWVHIESYIKNNSDADFTHGICPECAINLYPELFNKQH